MIDNVSTHGNAYCNDPQYLEFLGPQKTRVYYDWGLRAYVRATVQEPKTPQDRVQPVDEEATITRQPGDYELFDHRPQGAARRRVNADVIRRECMELLRDEPLNTAQIAELLGYSQLGVARWFQHRPPGFVQVARTLHGPLWGIEGVDYGDVYGGAMPGIVAYLREHGTGTATEICASLGIVYGTFTNTQRNYPDVLRCVEVRKIDGAMHKIWGLNE